MHCSKIFSFCLAAILLLCGGNNYAQDDLSVNFEQDKAKAVAELEEYKKQDIPRVDALIRVMKTSLFLKQQKVVKPYCDEALTISRNINS